MSGAVSAWALARIVETSDIITVDGREYLLTPASPDLVDCLAAFGTEGEDMEDEGVALDWTWIGQFAKRRVLIQDGEAEPLQADGGTR
ncbi:MAG: hypothetical protein AB7O49_10170 [Sphingomonadales bacterium]